MTCPLTQREIVSAKGKLQEFLSLNPMTTRQRLGALSIKPDYEMTLANFEIILYKPILSRHRIHLDRIKRITYKTHSIKL